MSVQHDTPYLEPISVTYVCETSVVEARKTCTRTSLRCRIDRHLQQAKRWRARRTEASPVPHLRPRLRQRRGDDVRGAEDQGSMQIQNLRPLIRSPFSPTAGTASAWTTASNPLAPRARDRPAWRAPDVPTSRCLLAWVKAAGCSTRSAAPTLAAPPKTTMIPSLNSGQPVSRQARSARSVRSVRSARSPIVMTNVKPERGAPENSCPTSGELVQSTPRQP